VSAHGVLLDQLELDEYNVVLNVLEIKVLLCCLIVEEVAVDT